VSLIEIHCGLCRRICNFQTTAMKKFILLFLYGIPMTSTAQPAPVVSNAFHWAELPVSKSTAREGRRIMEGSLPGFSYIEMHATTQQKGAVPRPPHAQKDLEELIIVTEGKMKFTIDKESRILGKGSVVLIPPAGMQSVENIGDGPLTYYVMMLRSEKPMDMERSAQAGGALLLDADSLTYKPSERGGGIKYFDRPTAMCENFEMHITHLSRKGPSHTPHAHTDTEIILVLEGETEMTINNKKYTASAGDLYIAVSGEMHGISNASDKPCRYFAFKWR
jgi:quercetin dioxygenase-like cupin family protein